MLIVFETFITYCMAGSGVRDLTPRVALGPHEPKASVGPRATRGVKSRTPQPDMQ